MSIGPLMSTTQRDDVIDFSLPITRVGVTAVEPRDDDSLSAGRWGRALGGVAGGRGGAGFSFVEPLSLVAWLTLFAVIPLVGAVLYCLERFSEGEGGAWAAPLGAVGDGDKLSGAMGDVGANLGLCIESMVFSILGKL